MSFGTTCIPSNPLSPFWEEKQHLSSSACANDRKARTSARWRNFAVPLCVGPDHFPMIAKSGTPCTGGGSAYSALSSPIRASTSEEAMAVEPAGSRPEPAHAEQRFNASTHAYRYDCPVLWCVLQRLLNRVDQTNPKRKKAWTHA